MTAYDILATAAGVVGIAAAVLFFALWLTATRRPARRPQVRPEPDTTTPRLEMRSPGAPVAGPFGPMPAGQTVVLPPRPHVHRANGSL